MNIKLVVILPFSHIHHCLLGSTQYIANNSHIIYNRVAMAIIMINSRRLHAINERSDIIIMSVYILRGHLQTESRTLNVTMTLGGEGV